MRTKEITPLVFWDSRRVRSGCGMGAFARNGTITDMVHRMQGFR